MLRRVSVTFSKLVRSKNKKPVIVKGSEKLLKDLENH
jgi:hypothetical protein